MSFYAADRKEIDSAVHNPKRRGGPGEGESFNILLGRNVAAHRKRAQGGIQRRERNNLSFK